MWESLDAAELQRQFNVRIAVPDADRFVKSCLRRSEAARQRLKGARDVRYGAGPRQLLDIFPAAQPNAPVAMFWHGGAWRAQSKEHYSFVAEPLVAAGVTAVLVGYDLFPSIDLRAMMQQARLAVAWTCKNIGGYGGDAEKIVVSGHSAGAQLSGMTLAHDFSAEGLPASPARGALLISGSFDMEPHTRHGRFAEMLDDAIARDASCALHPPLDPRVALVIAAGGDETPGYIWQTETFAKSCAERGHAVQMILPAGEHHFSVPECLADPDHALTRAFIRLARDGEVSSSL